MQKQQSKMMDLTTGPTFKNMVIFSMPIMLQGSFQLLYNVVDRYWVGKLGKEAMAAVSVGFPVMFFVISLVIGISIGAGIMIAQYRGAGDRNLTNLTARNFLVFGALVVLVISALMVTGTRWVLELLDTGDDFIADATIYLRWIFGGLIFFFTYNGVTGVFRGLGDSMTPVKVAAFSTVLNIVLDPILIFGLGPLPELGVEGAAIATVLANGAGAAWILIALTREREWVNLAPRGFRFNISVIRDMLRLGLPTTATMVIVSTSVMVIMKFVNHLGTAAVAAYGIGIVLDSFSMMPSQSFSMSMSAIAGQNMGAGKPERVGKFLRDTLIVSVSIAILVALVLNLSIEWIASVFQPNEEDFNVVYPLLAIYIQVMSVRYLMMSMFFPINGTIRGAGDTIAAMFLVIITQLVVRVPLCIWLAKPEVLGFAGIAVSLAASTIFGFLIVTIYYRTGIWKKRAIVINNSNGPAKVSTELDGISMDQPVDMEQ